jgi:hypothetical protein
MQDHSGQNPNVIGNKNYNFYCLFKDRHRRPVFVFQSKDVRPCNWRVCFGWTSLHFKTYREAMNYCKRQGFTTSNGKSLP